MTTSPCHVRQHSDLARCETCGLEWDTDASNPPMCRLRRQHVASSIVATSVAFVLMVACLTLMFVYILAVAHTGH